MASDRILLIDDEAGIRTSLSRVLADEGYEVEAVPTGEKGLERLREARFHLVFLDVWLPEKDGMEVLQEIRSSGLNRTTPVIVVSVAVEKDMGRMFPIQDCLPKPVQPPELLQALERAGVPPHRNRTVLVVDDDPATLRLMQATLAGLGYHAVCQPDGEAGLASLAQDRPALVLLDLMMPVLDGFQFLERLRRDPSLPHPPVIVWTNKDLSTTERAQLQGMAKAVLAKQDCTPKALLDQLRTIVG